MSALDQLFQGETEMPLHPKAAYWQGRLKQAGGGRCTIHRVRDGLSFRSPKIYLDFDDGTQDHDDWDADLNAFLIKNGIHSADEANEKLRFGLMLKDALRKPETRYGDGFYNAVLLELTEKLFSADPQIKAKLEALGPGNPHKERESYPACTQMIEGVFHRCALQLTQNLKYERETAERILSGAVDQYLDERFSFTNRRLLGWV